MANRIKGETPFTVPGADGEPGEDLTLLFDFNALCTLEEDLGEGVVAGEFELKKPSVIRQVFRAGLLACRPEITALEAGSIIHAIGVEKAGQLIADAFKAAYPQGGTAAATSGPQRKTGNPRRGTGTGA